MKNRILVGMIVALVGSSFVIAYAKRPRRPVAASHLKLAKSSKAVSKHFVARPAGLPTGEEIRDKSRQDFLNKEYEGTKLDLASTNAKDLDLHKRIANAFSANEFVPPERIAHFAWINDHADLQLRHQGWTGTINDRIATPNGMIVKVVFRPLLDSMKLGKSVVSGDFVIETYTFDGKNLTFVKLELPAKPPGILLFL